MTAVQILTHNLLTDLNADLSDLVCDERIMPEVLTCILKSMNEFALQEAESFISEHWGERCNVLTKLKTKYEINN